MREGFKFSIQRQADKGKNQLLGQTSKAWNTNKQPSALITVRIDAKLMMYANAINDY